MGFNSGFKGLNQQWQVTVHLPTMGDGDMTDDASLIYRYLPPSAGSVLTASNINNS